METMNSSFCTQCGRHNPAMAHNFYLLVREGRLSVYKLGAKTLVTSLAIQHFVQAAHEGNVTGQSDSDGGDSRGAG